MTKRRRTNWIASVLRRLPFPSNELHRRPGYHVIGIVIPSTDLTLHVTHGLRPERNSQVNPFE
jgi:hypothetical protein